jgi:hypothetical protein
MLLTRRKLKKVTVIKLAFEILYGALRLNSGLACTCTILVLIQGWIGL